MAISQQEYNQQYADDQLIKAIEGLDESQTEANIQLDVLVGSNAAIHKALNDTNELLLMLDDRLVAMHSMLTEQFSLAIARLVDVQTTIQSNSSNSQATDKTITTLNNAIEALNKDAKTREVALTAKGNGAELVKSLCSLIDTILDKKKASQFKNNAPVFADAMSVLFAPLDKIAELANNANFTAALTNLSEMFASAADMAKKAADSVLVISLTILGAIGSMLLLGEERVDTGAKMWLGTCLTFALGLAAIAKAASGADIKLANQFAYGIAAMTAALAIVSSVEWDELLRGGIALVGVTVMFGGALFVLSKIFSKSKSSPLSKFSKGVIQFAASIALLTATLALTAYVVEHVSWESLGKAAAIMLVVGAGLTVASRLIGEGTAKIAKDFAWFGLSLVTIGLALWAFDKIVQDISWQTYAIAGTSLLALVGVAWTAGKATKNTLLGVACLAAIAGVLWLTTEAIEPFTKFTWEQLGMAGATIGGLVAAMYLAGISAKMVFTGAGALLIGSAALLVVSTALQQWPWQISWEQLGMVGATLLGITAALYAAGVGIAFTLPGALALAGGAAAMLVMAKALQQWPWQITLEQYGLMAKGIGTIMLAIAAIGNPLTLPLILAGIGEVGGLAKALKTLAEGLKLSETIDFAKATSSAEQIIAWANNTVDGLKTFNVFGKGQAEKLLAPYKLLGDSLSGLAGGIITMASGTYEEYEVVNGERRLKAVHRIGPEMYAKFGEAVSSLLTGITAPLKQLGEGGGLFKKSDAEKGIANLKQLGDSVSSLGEAAGAIVDLAKVDFGDLDAGMPKLTKLTDVVKLFGEADSSVGVHSNFVKNIDSYVKAISKLDTGNVQLIVESAEAINTIANADLSNLQAIRDKYQEQLFERLDGIRTDIQGIRSTEQTAIAQPAQQIIQQSPTEEQTDGSAMLATISTQLSDIYALIAAM